MTDRKVALVTGSGTGVGAAAALMLAQRGYDLLINYSRSEQEAERSAAACREAGADVTVLRGTGELVLLDSGMHLGGIRSR
jgi:3-oxoacyl-[acyl-carrier protein] reductase